MTPEEELHRKLKAMFAAPIQIQYAKVVEIDEEEFLATIDVEYNGLNTWFVRLQSISNCKQGIKIWPKIGSIVLVGRIGNSNERLIVAYSEIDKIEWKIGEQVLVMTEDGFSINGGELGGLIKIEELVNRLNAIEDYVEDLADKFLTHYHACAAPGSPSGPPLGDDPAQNSPIILLPIEKTERDPLEDTKVTH